MVLNSREAVLANLARVREGIARACDRSGRDPAAVRLVAASKAVPAAAMRWAHEGGVEDFGENYVRELQAKREAVEGPRWHFIGTLQSHTAHRVADLADVVQTLTPGNAVARLSRRAAQRGRRMPALVEVDFTGERTGVAPQECVGFADAVSAMDGLELRGLMTLPPLPQVPEDTRPWFIRLRELLGEVGATH
ncbi:MAG TPA: alanine racemase, partial [Actinomycetota bacterium]|nr:alanine racemase [Actinomycetota bacterium]